MNKKALIIIVAVVALGAVFLLWRNNAQKNQFAKKIDQAQTSGSEVLAGEVKLDIKGFVFNPEIIKVKKGTKVTWTNQDDAPHTITSNEGSVLDSPAFGKGQSYEKTFDIVGTFPYHCKPHPNMIGAVIVVD